MGTVRILCGMCPSCHKKLFFCDHERSVECAGCSQRHAQTRLKDLGVAEDPLSGTFKLLQRHLTNILKKEQAEQQTVLKAEKLKVNGLSNYLCLLISPLLTSHGMDKNSGKAILLTDMGKPPVFDCGQLCDRAFLIQEEHLHVQGYGMDRSGSTEYLKGTLNLIKATNNNEDRLVPLHADGDGHCLVHAVSRCLVGWELFWHALRVNLRKHLMENMDKYQLQFGDFIDASEWPLIIKECDPDFVPLETETTGLRNIHIFGLANVLRRPIILLDSIAGMQSSGDYSGVFLPYFCPPASCANKDGVPHPPLVIAWSSSGRNHFIPLTGVKGKPCPVLPPDMTSRAWGVPDSEICNYLHLDIRGNCRVGGEKPLQTAYLQRLVSAMGDKFLKQHGISAALVADLYQQILRPEGYILGTSHSLLLQHTKACVGQGSLYLCMTCHGLTYQLPHNDISLDVSNKNSPEVMQPCHQCNSTELRCVAADYSVSYKNGDLTLTKSQVNPSGFKVYWAGKEYDTMPKSVIALLEWNNRKVQESVLWWQGEEDQTLNSNVYQIAETLVQKHFPGEFGSERLVQRVVDQIMLQVHKPTEQELTPGGTAHMEESWSPTEATKTILTGMQSKSVHKEELTKSASEKAVRENIQRNAVKQQRKSLDHSISGRKSPVQGLVARKVPDRNTLQHISEKSSMDDSMAHITSGSSPKLSSVNKRIRLSVSDGKNVTLDLPPDCSFLALQNLIASATDVAPSQQRIRYGFPPRELKPPENLKQDYRVPIQPGDRIMLDILAVTPTISSSSGHNVADSSRLSAERSKLDLNALVSQGNKPQATLTSHLLNSLVTEPDGNLFHGDNLDSLLSTLAMTAEFDGRSLWSYVQCLPQLFAADNMFGKQVARDHGLVPCKHYTIPLLPGKVFVYNASHHRLDICIEPYGHFAVQPDVECNAKILSPLMKCGLKPKAFLGQGHTLRSVTDDSMPHDVPLSTHSFEASLLSNPSLHQSSIEEEEEGEEMKDDSERQTSHTLPVRELRSLHPASLHHWSSSDSKLVRRGPGYSQLSPISENQTNEKMDALHQLISNIEESVDALGEEEEIIANGLSLQSHRLTRLGTFGEISPSSSSQFKKDCQNLKDFAIKDQCRVNSVGDKEQIQSSVITSCPSDSKVPQSKRSSCKLKSSFMQNYNKSTSVNRLGTNVTQSTNTSTNPLKTVTKLPQEQLFNENVEDMNISASVVSTNISNNTVLDKDVSFNCQGYALSDVTATKETLSILMDQTDSNPIDVPLDNLDVAMNTTETFSSGQCEDSNMEINLNTQVKTLETADISTKEQLAFGQTEEKLDKPADLISERFTLLTSNTGVQDEVVLSDATSTEICKDEICSVEMDAA